MGQARGPRSFRDGRGEMHRQLTATRTALRRNRAARNRYQAARARHDMRTWQIERRPPSRGLPRKYGLLCGFSYKLLSWGLGIFRLRRMFDQRPADML
jgi:hypothetical protein